MLEKKLLVNYRKCTYVDTYNIYCSVHSLYFKIFAEFDDFPILPSRSHVLLGRSYYTILMYNDITKSLWNVTYVDYSSHTMSAEMAKEYSKVSYKSL